MRVAASAGVPEASRVQVFDARTPDAGPLSSQELAADLDAAAAFRNAQTVDTFLRTKFDRNGWDGEGSPYKVRVHTPNPDGTPMNNAQWDGKKVDLGDGDGELFRPFGHGLDVLAHEIMHGVVQDEVNMRYRGQQGALNESFADVFAAAIDGNWEIGEQVFTPARDGDAIRALNAPTYPHLSTLPEGVDEVHELSGIPSLAAVKVAEATDRETMTNIWYRALTEHLTPHMGFSGAARSTMTAARDLYGRDSAQFSAVRDAWEAVGVNPRWKD